MPTSLPARPSDATLSVTKAARLLGVHPNTIRAWSDAGRLRYYRINARGDRRYRSSDLQRFLVAAEAGARGGIPSIPASRRGGRRRLDPSTPARFGMARQPVDEPPEADPLDTDRHRVDLEVAATISRLTNTIDDSGVAIQAAVEAIRDAYGHHLVVAWEARDDRLRPRASAGTDGGRALRLTDLPARHGIVGQVLETAIGRGRSGRAWTRGAVLPATLVELGGAEAGIAALGRGRPELAVVIPGAQAPWGVLSVIGEGPGSLDARDLAFARVAAEGLGAMVGRELQADGVAHLLHRAEALQRVATDIGSRLDLDQVLAGVVDHAMVLFDGDRAAVFLQQPDGRIVAEVSRGLSSAYLGTVRDFPARSLPTAAVAARRPLFSLDYRSDPRGEDMRAAVIQEGYVSICTAPLLDGSDLLGLLNIYHDSPHPWTSDELDTIGALAAQATVAIRTAQDYARMATWAAQLQSIQQLSARLSRLSSVAEIGDAIATELRQLIDYHNVRVYRLEGQDLVPVAMQGQVGEYVDETAEQLRTTIGQGITGWVAARGIAQNLGNAAADPRASTIPGTEDDLDESMLLAPMIFDDRVIGVLVLSKLGLDQFTDDDLRLLEIYASCAAQAMANAETSEQLHRQTVALEVRLRGQRELLEVTQSLLTTLDAPGVLESITDRLGRLVGYDNAAIEVVDPVNGQLTPLTARGIHAAAYLEPWEPGETGIAIWVVEHNEPALIVDERNDPRVNHFRDDLGTGEGSLIVVPLRGRVGAIGVLTVERLGRQNPFNEEEFDLVQLFAAQVSIALQNAEVFQAVQIRARTDDLTGLLNHGTFQEYLGRYVGDGTPFSLIMLDLDDFRTVNNELGHQAGDALLRKIADGLVGAERELDLVFRYGGDEFAVLLPLTEFEGALHVAERVRRAVADTGVSITASIGVASFPNDGATAADILLAADRACFVAKRNGRDRIATAAEGLALAAEMTLQAPTPVDSAAPTSG